MTGKYDPTRHPDTITALARLGLTDAQIAHDLGISTKTLYQWKKKYVAVGEALREGKSHADGQVMLAHYKRATGYTYIEKKTTIFPDGSRRVETTEKHIPADPTMISMWERLRMPKYWQDTQKMEVTGAEGGPLQVRMMTDEELVAAAEKTMRQVKR
jgi:transposase-like protein